MPTLASGLRISSQLGPVETIPQTHRGPHGLSMIRSVKRAIVGMSGDPSNIRLMFVYRRARRVRWRLPPPPARPADARTPGSCRGSPPFSRYLRGDFSNLGRRPEEARCVQDEAERWVPEIVSRARFRGPGWALPEHAPAQSGPRIRGLGTAHVGARSPEVVAPVRIGIPVVPHSPGISQILFLIAAARVSAA